MLCYALFIQLIMLSLFFKGHADKSRNTEYSTSVMKIKAILGGKREFRKKRGIQIISNNCQWHLRLIAKSLTRLKSVSVHQSTLFILSRKEMFSERLLYFKLEKYLRFSEIIVLDVSHYYIPLI